MLLKLPMEKLRRPSKALILFIINGAIYYLIEFIWKNYISSNGGVTHWSMFILGGICGIAVGAINEYLPWEMPLLRQAAIGTGIILTLEFAFGVVLNLILELGIWDYSHLPLNLLGQICAPFAIAWFGLAIVAILLDDWLRWKLFGGEKPHYKVF